VIDPSLIFSTYSGSRTDNWGFSATYDSKGNGFGGGIIFTRGYPVTPGAIQDTFQGGFNDIVISKFSADGRQLLFATYLGGNETEQPHSMVAGANDELWVYGRTFSTDFPVTASAYDTTHNGGADLYVTKLDSNGLLLASTYIGGTDHDGIIFRGGIGQPRASRLYLNYGDDARGEIDLDDRGNCYIATVTASQDFPIAKILPVKSFSGGLDACIAKLNNDLSELLWSSYFGGSEDDAVVSIAIEEEDKLFITGTTMSDDFPVSSTAVNPVFQGVMDCFVASLDLKNSSLVSSTYLGTDSVDAAFFVELDKDKNVYIYGQTFGDIGVIGTPYFQNEAKQFITKFNPTLSSIEWQAPFGTFFSSYPDITPTAFLVDNCYRIYVSGWGPAGFSIFQGVMPLTDDALQDTTDGSHFYFAVFEKDMDSLIYATYFGELGSGQPEHVDGGTSRFDKRGVIYQAVCASCGGTNDFPTTSGAYSRQNGTGGGGVGAGGCNLALFKIDFELPSVDADFIPEDEDNLPQYIGCAPFEVNFNNTSSHDPGATFVWDFGDGTPTQTTANPTHVFAQKGNYQVSLIVNDPNSCNKADTITKEIIVFTPAYADAGPDLEICAGQSITLQSEASANMRIRWTPSISLSNDSIEQPIASPLQTTTYYLAVSDNEACADLDSVTVKVNPQTILRTLGDTVVCEGTSFSLWALGADTYEWSPTSPINNPFRPDPTAKLSQATRFRVIGNEALCPDTAYIQVDVIPKGQTTVFAEANPICSGKLAWMQASGGDRYVWSNGWDSDRIGPRIEDTTTFIVTAYNGDCPAVPDTVTINVVPHPIAAFVPLRISNYAPVRVELINKSEHANSYLWDYGLYSSLRTIENPSFVYEDTGTYRIRLWAFNELGCQDRTEYFLTVEPTWLEIPTAFSPNGDDINDVFFFPNSGFDRFELAIFNRWGRKVYHTADPNFRWDGTFRGQAVPEGVYVYTLKGYGFNGRVYERQGNLTIIR
jgi:gliding motility-associated-like protein